MTLLILGLDALDEGLIDEFGVHELRLNTSTRMKSVAHVREEPYTPEAWATIATGLHPREHGVSTGTSTWDNSIVDFFSNYAGYLSMGVRDRLGDVITRATGANYTIREVDAPTMFDGDDRIVHNWPGVSRGSELKRAWDIMVPAGQTEASFERDIFGLAAEQFGWGREMLRHKVSVAGVHIHLLDATGHAYCRQPNRLEAAYHRTAEFVAEIQDRLGEDDELLILSDHGMVVDFYSDEDDRGLDTGIHSWRAFASSTADTVPETVFEVRDWVDEHASAVEGGSDSHEIDMDQLRDLGYV